jgi:hypothetical protein
LVELRVVVPAAAGSSPVAHPLALRYLALASSFHVSIALGAATSSPKTLCAVELPNASRGAGETAAVVAIATLPRGSRGRAREPEAGVHGGEPARSAILIGLATKLVG